jgi:hypothetical protein
MVLRILSRISLHNHTEYLGQIFGRRDGYCRFNPRARQSETASVETASVNGF